MLRMVIPIFRSRVSPVFDSCVRAWLLDIDQHRVVAKKELYLNKLTLSERFKLLRQAGATVIVCGHISDLFYDMLSKGNIKIINGIAGAADEVVDAFISGRLYHQAFHMPGFTLKPLPKRKNNNDDGKPFESKG